MEEKSDFSKALRFTLRTEHTFGCVKTFELGIVFRTNLNLRFQYQALRNIVERERFFTQKVFVGGKRSPIELYGL